MADQQPENSAAGAPDESPAAGPPTRPDPTRVESTRQTPDPTRIEGGSPAADGTASQADPTAAETPGRWSGSAVVPAHVPKRTWWARRRAEEEALPAAADPWADSEDWSATPAVDPWAEQDTPWQAEIPFPEAMPPTRIDAPSSTTRPETQLPQTRDEAQLPPTRHEAQLPPTRHEAQLAPTRLDPPSPPVTAPQSRPAAPLPQAYQPPAAPKPAAPAPAPAPAQKATQPATGEVPPRRWWTRKDRVTQTPANRLPVQTRPSAPQPPARPAPAPAQPARPVPARPAPPPWKPPAQTRPPAGQRPLPPPRRKRRWPRRLFLFTLFSLVCCCGVPGYFLWPAAQQYPVSAVLPQSVSDLNLRDDGASRRAVERLTEDLRNTSLAQGDVFAGVYTDGNGKKVTVFGTTGLRMTPQDDVEAEIAHLATEYKIKEVQTYDLGETGVHERCGVGRSGGNAVVVCAWADHGSLATVMLTRRSVSESAELTGVLRSVVLTRG
ncbi:hypothetical protein [Actinoplanes friuliensis]|uniref:Uncharacterized protein n=1 Tax=Actinoplanes friuliensis DSM 7358 TaxID=1246995 RepID=U5VSM7_9ACTN|nr:hypothetical protein [Actinoplanes friuliensis]AGZ39817.1 hypothetical protein AFR_07640 [Actinoplanes friuliensis DSM 7358]